MYINTISYNNNIFYYYFLQSFRWNWIKHNKWVVWKSRIGLARICFWVGPCQPITPWCYTVQSFWWAPASQLLPGATVQSFWVGPCQSVIPSTEFLVGPCQSITPWCYCAEFLGWPLPVSDSQYGIYGGPVPFNYSLRLLCRVSGWFPAVMLLLGLGPSGQNPSPWPGPWP